MAILVVVSVYFISFIWCNGKLQSQTKVLTTLVYGVLALLVMLLS